jgi:hypothetical protein
VVKGYYLARGKIFQCGGLVMAPEYFFKTAEILGIYTELNHIAHAHYPNLRSIPYPSLVGAFFHFEGFSRGGSTLVDLLARNRGLQSYDKRDRVFALVRLSSDADPSLIDYGREIQAVLIQVGKKAIRERLEGNELSTALDFFCFASPDSSVEGLPWWVPSFNLPMGLCLMKGIFPMARPLNTVPQVLIGEYNVSMDPASSSMLSWHWHGLNVD